MTHYQASFDPSHTVCGKSVTEHKAVTGLDRIPEVTCPDCQAELIKAGSGLVRRVGALLEVE